MKKFLNAAGAVVLGMIGWQIARAYDSLNHPNKPLGHLEVAKPLVARPEQFSQSNNSSRPLSIGQQAPSPAQNANPKSSAGPGFSVYTLGSDRDPAVMGKSDLPAGSYSNYEDGSGNSSQKTLNKFCSRLQSATKYGFLGSMVRRYDMPLQKLAMNNDYELRGFSTKADGNCRASIKVVGIEGGKSYRFEKECLINSIIVRDDGKYVADIFDVNDCI